MKLLGIDEYRILGHRLLVGTNTGIGEDVGLDLLTMVNFELLVLEVIVEVYNTDILRDILGNRANEIPIGGVKVPTSEGAEADPPLLTIHIHEDERVLRSIVFISCTTLLLLDNKLIEELDDCTFLENGDIDIHLHICEIRLAQDHSSPSIGLSAEDRNLFFIVSYHTNKKFMVN